MTGWRDLAACNGEDPDLFYPPTHRQAEAARQVCRRCPVRGECLSDAIAEGDEWAVRGALTGRERRDLMNAARVAPDPEAAEHRRVLLAELDAWEAAHRGEGRPRAPSGAVSPWRRASLPSDPRIALLTRAHAEAARHRNAGRPLPGPLAELDREYGRIRKQRQRGSVIRAA